MVAKYALRIALLAALASGGLALPVPGLDGVAPAEAKEFYTRKRVNGRWVTGRFPKRGSDTARVERSRTRTAAAANADEQSVPTPPPAIRPAPSLPVVPAAAAAVPADPIAVDPGQSRLAPLKHALEQRARSMTSAQSEAAPNVRSVTYDFAGGVKTVIYLDGTVREEPLDAVVTGQVGVR